MIMIFWLFSGEISQLASGKAALSVSAHPCNTNPIFQLYHMLIHVASCWSVFPPKASVLTSPDVGNGPVSSCPPQSKVASGLSRHPQMDGQVNHHPIRRGLIIVHLFGDDYLDDWWLILIMCFLSNEKNQPYKFMVSIPPVKMLMFGMVCYCFTNIRWCSHIKEKEF